MKTIMFVGALAMTAAQPALAQDWWVNTDPEPEQVSMAHDGFRVEARAMYETPTVDRNNTDEFNYKLGDAFAFGGEAGYDVALGNRFVVGPYGKYEKSTVESCADGACARITDYYEVGGHLGYALGPNGQLYGKVGYGEMGIEVEGTDSFGTFSESESSGGLAFALGFEFGLGETAYVRLEAAQADVGEIFTFDWKRQTAGGAIGVRF